jgi:NADH-quinone oxidoreductase subunit G
MCANADVREHQMLEDADSPLSFSMEGYEGQPASPLITHFWAPSWNSVQSVNKFQSEVGGELRGGDPGFRLIEPKQSAKAEYFKEIPDAFKVRDDELLVVPSCHVFGSEELSAMSPGIAQLSARPYLMVNSSDADNLTINKEGKAEITLSGVTYFLFLESSSAVPRGVAIVPTGLTELQWDGLPFRLKLKRK